MRIHFTNTVTCSKHADAIARELRNAGIKITPTRARNVLGRMLGYRSWREFSATCPVVGTPSSFDEDCTATVVTARLKRQSEVLHAEFGIPKALARKIVDTVRPTARGGFVDDPATIAKAEALAVLSHARKFDGFVTRGLASATSPAGKPALVVARLGATVKVWLRKAEMYERARSVIPHRFDVMAYVDGRVVGVLRGYGLSHRIHGDVATRHPNHGFQSAYDKDVDASIHGDAADAMVDAYGPDVGAMVHTALRNLGEGCSSVTSPTPTDGLILPVTWETSAEHAAPGLGIELWKALFKAYDGKRWGYGTLLFNPAPPQYANVSPLIRHAKLGYQIARAKLFDHLSALVDDSEVLRPPMFQAYRDALIAEEGSPTRTARSEPRPLGEGQWPAGYDLEWLFEPKSHVKVAPSPLLWRNMPTDLSRITVVYHEVKFAGQVDSAPSPEEWEFHFTNGTTLMLTDEAMRDYSQDGQVFPHLLDREGGPLLRNPYTSRMTVKDMLDVLAFNAALVFGGSSDMDGQDTGRVTLSRA